MTTRHAWIVAALGLALVAAAGCGGGAKAPAEGSGRAAAGDAAVTAGDGTTAAAPRGEGHAEGSVVPGSHEDWCDEHAVPETACTRCDASLIPAFKAVSDWCDEHGLPKSQCLRCDPKLRIVRPAKTGGS
jgi:hypothetical protein